MPLHHHYREEEGPQGGASAYAPPSGGIVPPPMESYYGASNNAYAPPSGGYPGSSYAPPSDSYGPPPASYYSPEYAPPPQATARPPGQYDYYAPPGPPAARPEYRSTPQGYGEYAPPQGPPPTRPTQYAGREDYGRPPVPQNKPEPRIGPEDYEDYAPPARPAQRPEPHIGPEDYEDFSGNRLARKPEPHIGPEDYEDYVPRKSNQGYEGGRAGQGYYGAEGAGERAQYAPPSGPPPPGGNRYRHAGPEEDQYLAPSKPDFQRIARMASVHHPETDPALYEQVAQNLANEHNAHAQDEDHEDYMKQVHKAHGQAYGNNTSDETMDSDAIGAAAALEAFKMTASEQQAAHTGGPPADNPKTPQGAAPPQAPLPSRPEYGLADDYYRGDGPADDARLTHGGLPQPPAGAQRPYAAGYAPGSQPPYQGEAPHPAGGYRHHAGGPQGAGAPQGAGGHPAGPPQGRPQEGASHPTEAPRPAKAPRPSGQPQAPPQAPPQVAPSPARPPTSQAPPDQEEDSTPAFGGGLEGKLMAMAMGGAAKLFDKKTGGSGSSSEKMQAMQSAAQTAMKLAAQYRKTGKVALEPGDMQGLMMTAMSII